MTRRILATAILAAAAFAQEKKAPEKPKAPALTTAELEKMINEDYFFLDVRSAKEIEELGTVKKYVHIPVEELEARLKEIPRGKTVVTLCNRGGRAARAAVILEKNGYQVAGSCGLEEWKKKGNPLVYPKAKP